MSKERFSNPEIVNVTEENATVRLSSMARRRAMDNISSRRRSAVTRAPARAISIAARPVPVPDVEHGTVSGCLPQKLTGIRACSLATNSPIGPPKRRSSKDWAVAGSAWRPCNCSDRAIETGSRHHPSFARGEVAARRQSLTVP